MSSYYWHSILICHICHNQWTNIGTVILARVHTLLRFIAFFLKRDVSFTHLLMYSIIYLSICTPLIGIFNIFCVITQYSFLFLSNFLTFRHWELFELALSSFEMFITGLSLFCLDFFSSLLISDTIWWFSYPLYPGLMFKFLSSG